MGAMNTEANLFEIYSEEEVEICILGLTLLCLVELPLAIPDQCFHGL